MIHELVVGFIWVINRSAAAYVGLDTYPSLSTPTLNLPLSAPIPISPIPSPSTPIPTPTSLREAIRVRGRAEEGVRSKERAREGHGAQSYHTHIARHTPTKS